ncbi:tetratricopeptide repeat protein [Nordella sp. HKS 07]|uniref:tetratricopeptide repeat protein n=1 Tax=Nordella sp. HKS 07 TaxID=2712222 RepID=UPI00352CCDAE
MQEGQRRLAAILAADVAGYSRLMAADESGTLGRLRRLRAEVFEPKIAQFYGRIVGSAGDSLLIEFASAVNAVQCAVEVQRELDGQNANLPEDRRMAFRVGVNLGDVIAEDNTIHGDGVNVAARLEKLAEPGGVCIGHAIYDQVKGKLAYTYDDLGEQRVHNIAEPVRAYRVKPANASVNSLSASPARDARPLPDRPSIAVLPFQNMSGDVEQEYFADGLADDLITDLSKIPGFLVIARNSTFAYKGRAVDIRSVAKDLGVRYVIEGSVRRSATRLRINAQLIDAANNSHLWADRFDRDLADVFLLQDEIVGKIVNALTGALPSPSLPSRRKATTLESYDMFVRGRAVVIQSPESNRAALPLLEKAIELDPEFADAHAWLAKSHEFAWTYGGEAKEPHHSLALAAVQRALALDPQNADAHTILGNHLLHEGELDKAEAELAIALRIDPNHANGWAFLGELKVSEGLALDGVELALKAFRLNPYPPGWYHWLLGYTQYAARHYEDAVRTLRHETTYQTGSCRLLAASLAQLGRLDEAKVEGRRFLAINPNFTIQHWASIVPFRYEADRQHFIDGYTKAGLPM